MEWLQLHRKAEFTNMYQLQGSGPSDAFDLNIGDETNGSYLTSPTFAANAGAALEFYFNYITSDGDEYIEYAWAELIDTSDDSSTILFTARTTASGDTVPGNGLPGLAPGVTLTPASTPIIPGGPDWSPSGTIRVSAMTSVAATRVGSGPITSFPQPAITSLRLES